MKIIKKSAYAKINLALQVLNKRPDGYHNINSVFYPVDLADRVTLAKSDKIEVTTEAAIAAEDNLAYKAALKILDKYKIKAGVRIELEKVIPMGGGLGGGSSDAAAVLLGINELFRMNLKYYDLLILAQALGSDVPFFLSKSAATVTGRGEFVSYFPFRLFYKIVIVNPGIHVSTPEAYSMLQRDEKERPLVNFRLILEKSLANPSLLKSHFINDFEEPVFSVHEEIGSIKEKLYSIGAIFALMSGSGSTVFGLLPQNADNDKIRAAFGNYFTYICD